jgi:transcription initiation factor TFIID TATA-box-binding protein
METDPPSTVCVHADALAEEAGPSAPRVPEVILISNIVITCSLNQPLNLDEVAWRFHGEYNPSTFAAVQLRLCKPQTTALVFSTGKCVVTGARSESAAYVAVQLFYAMLKSVHPKLRITEQNIQNIVSSSSLGKCLAVDQMAKKFCISSHYDPGKQAACTTMVHHLCVLTKINARTLPRPAPQSGEARRQDPSLCQGARRHHGWAHTRRHCCCVAHPARLRPALSSRRQPYARIHRHNARRAPPKQGGGRRR